MHVTVYVRYVWDHSSLKKLKEIEFFRLAFVANQSRKKIAFVFGKS